jgi:hypothetical protein
MKVNAHTMKMAEKLDDQRTAGKSLNRKERRFLAAIEKKLLKGEEPS